MNTQTYQILLTQKAWHFLRCQRALRKLHLPYKIVTLHTSDGRKRKAFRVSATTGIFLASLGLIHFNF